MIEINLVPDHLRKKRKKNLFPKGLSLPREAVVGLVGGLIVLLIIVHVLLQLNIFVKFAHHAYLRRQWEKIRPEKEKVDVVLNELRTLRNKLNSIEQVTTGDRISWARKLNDISNSIPRGVWLSKIAVGEGVLLIDGNAVSRHRDEIISVGDFVNNLKKRETFMKGLDNIEVGSIQRRKIKTVEISEFLITVKIQ